METLSNYQSGHEGGGKGRGSHWSRQGRDLISEEVRKGGERGKGRGGELEDSVERVGVYDLRGKRVFKQGSYKCSGLVVTCCLLGLFISMFLSKFWDVWALAFYYLSRCLAPGSGFREGYMDITIFCLAPFIFPDCNTNLYSWLSWFLMSLTASAAAAAAPGGGDSESKLGSSRRRNYRKRSRGCGDNDESHDFGFEDARRLAEEKLIEFIDDDGIWSQGNLPERVLVEILFSTSLQ
ncbi:hypothetical protein C1H46_014651 [Malus baccata]|uniref:Uncharacterized protein n=1 Tax=Malus baccata TaxID=106549 RepID=A0A540MNC4_MALBA|nr:hypothetical protein C1H46_014651 [Malus baccata]